VKGPRTPPVRGLADPAGHHRPKFNDDLPGMM
jgi:hypothetical protein